MGGHSLQFSPGEVRVAVSVVTLHSVLHLQPHFTPTFSLYCFCSGTSPLCPCPHLHLHLPFTIIAGLVGWPFRWSSKNTRVDGQCQ